MSKIIEGLDAILYPGIERNWDDRIFRNIILRFVTKDSIVLDLGAGAGLVKEMDLRGHAGRICGIDPDKRVLQNPFLQEAKIGSGEAIEYSDCTFDIVVADNVLEHVNEPRLVFTEVWRVLKPGGLFLAKTPNRKHYMPLIARFTSHRFHKWFNKRRGRDENETFATLYKVNSVEDVKKYAAETGLTVESIELVESRPEYLRIFWVTYLLGWLYEKLVNYVDVLSRFRVVMIITLRRPSESK